MFAKIVFLLQCSEYSILVCINEKKNGVMGMFGAYQGRHAQFGLRLFRYKIHAAADFIINILAKLQHLAYIANFFAKKIQRR